MRNIIITITFILTTIAGIAAYQIKDPAIAENQRENVNELASVQQIKEQEMRISIRNLLEDQAIWTRNLILCIIDDLPGTENAKKRLLKNSDYLVDAIVPAYKGDDGRKLTDLLRINVSKTTELIELMKDDRRIDFIKVYQELGKNVTDISNFLYYSNQVTNPVEINMGLHDYLRLITEETMARCRKDYSWDVSACDRVHRKIVEISDMLANGLNKKSFMAQVD